MSGKSARREVTIAAASNLNQVFATLGPQFEAATGIHPIFSFASTAQLALQITNGGPYDVYVAADKQHVDALVKKHLLVPGSRTIYATGILALWIPPRRPVGIEKLEDLAKPGVKIIALAKPELAPYGDAARDTLRALGLWDQLQPKIVYADNISMAKQYGVTGNADAVFTAYSLVMKEKGKVIPVKDKLHLPIDQALGIVAASKHHPEARLFVDYLLKGRGREILANSGYRVPVR